MKLIRNKEGIAVKIVGLATSSYIIFVAIVTFGDYYGLFLDILPFFTACILCLMAFNIWKNKISFQVICFAIINMHIACIACSLFCDLYEDGSNVDKFIGIENMFIFPALLLILLISALRCVSNTESIYFMRFDRVSNCLK